MFLRASLTSPLLFVDAAVAATRERRWNRVATVEPDRRKARPTIVLLAGTRPECIKLVPILRALEAHQQLRPVLVNSGQHLGAVDRTLAEFGVTCDVSLAPLPKFHHLAAAHEHLCIGLGAVFRQLHPDLVIVQGDTLTAYSGARAASQTGTPLAHLEAGLRTDAVAEPFPEEWFRRRIAQYAQMHFAPTRSSVNNLLAEGTASSTIHLVGNTGIDSLRAILPGILDRACANGEPLRDTVLVTLHRRENHDRNAGLVCDALIELVAARPDLRVVFPVHPNPKMASTIRRRLGSHAAFSLVDPMSYRDFIAHAARAALIISDSGGIQEEAPHLGTPLLVPRTNTERPEGLATGFVQLVPADRDVIVRTALDAMASPRRDPLPFDDDAPFGCGNAAQKITEVLETVLLRRSATAMPNA